MTIEYRLPDLGEGITEGELVRWLVKPGDRVGLDQAVAEVQTDKAVVELPAPAAGTIASLNADEGQILPVETLLLTIEEEAAPQAETSTDGAAPIHDQRSLAANGGSAKAEASPLSRDAGWKPAALASRFPQEPGGQLAMAPGGTGNGAGRWTEASVAPQRRALATPAVRRLARELGLDIATVRGSGPAGRILAEDVRGAAAVGMGAATASAQIDRAGHAEDAALAAAVAPKVTRQAEARGEPARTSVSMPGDVEEGPEEERLPLRGLRRRIAENMVLSTSTMPQVTSLVEVDAAGLVTARRAALPLAEQRGIKLSYLPFIVKALVQALRAHPYVNAAIDDATKEIVLKHRYHIGIATATPDGLLVPVLRHADRLTTIEVAAELNRLAEAGRERKLGLDELRGSTFTISNYGSVGGFFATPIINPGEAAILGLGRIAERPWVVEGRVEPRPILPLSFTADHRLIDGELAMRFLNTLVGLLENPGRLLLEMR